jgi:hypothetical protein
MGNGPLLVLITGLYIFGDVQNETGSFHDHPEHYTLT